MNAPVILHDISLFYYRLVVANCQLFSFLHISNSSLVYLYAVFILKMHIHSILDTIDFFFYCLFIEEFYRHYNKNLFSLFYCYADDG